LSTTQDQTQNSNAQVLADNNLYELINASISNQEGRTIRTNDTINFSSQWTTGTSVDAAYVTFKLYYNGILICQDGDDDTGGTQLPDGGTAELTGNCTPSSEIKIPVNARLNYIINVWAETIGGGADALKRANLTWDTFSDDTFVIIESISSVDINVTTNASSYVPGDTVNASGTFFWQNGTRIPNKNVTVIFYNTTGGIKQQNIVTTDSNGEYSDTYLVSSSDDPGHNFPSQRISQSDSRVQRS